MNPAFHYKVFSRVVNRVSPEKIDFITNIKEFKNENPIISREQAFNYYQNYLDVLMQGVDKVYSSDYQARTYLQPFLGYIAVIMVVDEEIEELHTHAHLNEVPNEFVIHSIPINDIGALDGMMGGLEIEYKCYQRYSYDVRGYKRSIQFFGCTEQYYSPEEADLQTFTILETPFDWSRYTEPRSRKDAFENEFHWTGFEIAENDPVEESETTIENTRTIPDISSKEKVLEIISHGEGNQVEFKPTLVYNFKTGRSGIGIKGIIAKAICAFLNASGGHLVIGVMDNGQIQGLDNDYKLAPSGKNPKDYFKLEFDDMIKQFFPLKVRHYISTHTFDIDKKDVFVVSVWPSKNPIFMNGFKNSQTIKEFYVRGEASSNLIENIEEIVDYCLEHFRKETQ